MRRNRRMALMLGEYSMWPQPVHFFLATVLRWLEVRQQIKVRRTTWTVVKIDERYEREAVLFVNISLSVMSAQREAQLKTGTLQISENAKVDRVANRSSLEKLRAILISFFNHSTSYQPICFDAIPKLPRAWSASGTIDRGVFHLENNILDSKRCSEKTVEAA